MFSSPQLNLNIRLITASDNEKIASVIKNVLTEFGFSKGSSADDPQLADLTGYYNHSDQHGAYYVVSDASGKIYGGGGFARLAGSAPDEHICELQKFYFSPEIRRLGYGKTLLHQILKNAMQKGYYLAYLETASSLESSIRLYQSFGFHACEAKGNSGHQGVCDIRMQLELEETQIDTAYRCKNTQTNTSLTK